MNIFPDLLRPLSTAASLEAGLDRTLRRIVRFSGADGGLLVFRPPLREPVVVIAKTRLPIVIGEWLVALAAGRSGRRAAVRDAQVLRVPLGTPRHPVGELVLVAGRRRRRLRLPDDFPRELGAALELLDESRRRADELAALYATSRLITARLDLPSVLDRISRSVTALIGSTGCGIALMSADGRELVQAAAHGFKSDEWRALQLPVGEGIIGRCAETREPMLVDDVRQDSRSARRDVDDREGIRSMLCVPMMRGDRMLGVIAAFSTRPATFAAHHQRVLERFGEQAAIAIHNAQLFEDSVRRAREIRALLGAGRAVTASLDVDETIRVILTEARSVLGVESCGLLAVDPSTGELGLVASLDLPSAFMPRVRLRVGEGISGIAVAEQRPIQSPDLWNDARVRYPELPKSSGLRSMLAAPLRLGERAIGAILALRRDVHTFTPGEEELLQALADQAAIALDHARLYGELEARVQERTRQLDEEKRFVEVVLETLPLGVFVLDGSLTVVRANPAGTDVLRDGARGRGPFRALFPGDKAGAVESLVRDAMRDSGVRTMEEEMVVTGSPRVLRLTVAALAAPGEAPAHTVVLVEDVTRAKRLERQMLLAERLTTAGRLAAGVAHELNNPLATIAGCAESLLERTRDLKLDATEELGDLRAYLATIEEEAYRCKEITGTLLQFVREPGSRREPTDLNALVVRGVELLAHQSRFATSTVVTELDPDMPEVNANEGQLRQVILGLAANGLEAMDGRGRLTIRTRLAGDDVSIERTAVKEVIIEFADEGPGIAADVLPRIFDPFFTTKPPGQGTGLGLAIAQGIVADHGGRIEVGSKPGESAVFRVVLPA
jgi:signal transduction histidine kinase/putative methionine-R-sulfoxide reductase with GAF domain